MGNFISIKRRLIGSSRGKNVTSNDENDSEIEQDIMDMSTITASAFYLFIIIFIGIPMWWYTCTTTRYPLPDLTELRDILESKSSHLHLDVSVIYLQPKPDEKLLEYLRDDLPQHIDTHFDNITYQILWRIRRPTQPESSVFKSFEESNNSKLIDLELELTKLHKSSNRFRLFIYVPEESKYEKYGCKSSHTYNIGYERFIFMCPNNLLGIDNKFSPIKNMIQKILHVTHIDSVERVNYLFASKIDLVVTMIPESADQIDYLHEKTNLVHHIFNKNVRNKFSELTEILNIKLITQQMFDYGLKTIETVNASRRLVDMKEVDSIFNKFESRVSKHSAKYVFNLLLFITQPDKPSLVFKQESTSKLSDELSILIGPDSNSLLIANDDKTLVLGFRTLVRHLLGLSSVGLCDNCQVTRDVFLNRWELDAIMGILTMKKLQSTILSLQSINTQISSIRILKDVADKVKRAHESALESLTYLNLKNTLDAYRKASSAYELSEVAFFDPSLLESLYFPEDLKYAVYLPFFLPLAFPITISIVRLLKAFFNHLRKTRTN